MGEPFFSPGWDNRKSSVLAFDFPPYHHCNPPISTSIQRKLAREKSWRERAWRKWKKKGILSVKPSRDQLYQLLHECSSCPCALWTSQINARARGFVSSLDRNIFDMRNNLNYELFWWLKSYLELVGVAHSQSCTNGLTQTCNIPPRCTVSDGRKTTYAACASDSDQLLFRDTCMVLARVDHTPSSVHLSWLTDADNNMMDIHWMGIRIY